MCSALTASARDRCITTARSTIRNCWRRTRLQFAEQTASAGSRPRRRSSPARVCALAFVPIKLFLQIGLRVLDAWQCAQRSCELLATYGAGSDARHRSQMFNDPDRAFRHAFLPSQWPSSYSVRCRTAMRVHPGSMLSKIFIQHDLFLLPARADQMRRYCRCEWPRARKAQCRARPDWSRDAWRKQKR